MKVKSNTERERDEVGEKERVGAAVDTGVEGDKKKRGDSKEREITMRPKRIRRGWERAREPVKERQKVLP